MTTSLRWGATASAPSSWSAEPAKPDGGSAPRDIFQYQTVEALASVASQH